MGINYKDINWINNFVKEVLTEEDIEKFASFSEHDDTRNKNILKKLGYKKITFDYKCDKEEDDDDEEEKDDDDDDDDEKFKYFFVNQNGKIEEDTRLEQYEAKIVKNHLFKKRCDEVRRKKLGLSGKRKKILVNYNDQEWIERFVKEVLTEEDFKDYNKIDERVLDKLGYEKITAVFHDNNYDNWKTNTYVFINQDGEIEEDMELFKFRQYIFRNPEFMAKLHELLKKQF